MFKNTNTFALITDDEIACGMGTIECQSKWAVKQPVSDDEVAAFVAGAYSGFDRVFNFVEDGILTVSYRALDI